MSSETLDHRGRPVVAVTGMGIKCPAGLTVDEAWASMLAAESKAARITRFDPSPLSVQFACELTSFDASEYFDVKEIRRVDRCTQFAVGAATDAIADAGELGADPARVGVIAASGVGGLETFMDQFETYFTKGPDRVSPFFIPMMMPNASAGTISIRNGFTGPALCVATACAAGTNGIGEAVRMIQNGTCDAMVAGGTEAAIVPMALAAFGRMGALSKRNDSPTTASRPFAADRDGFVMGEGAAFFVLERLDHAQARGARIYGTVAGYGANSDAHHITAPSPEGTGATSCIQSALDDAGLSATDIGHINAHGTSTPLNDAAEAEAVAKVFGERSVPVTSNKGVIGHLVAGAGAVEAVIAMKSAYEGVVPPTANTDACDPELAIDLVTGTAREITKGKAVLSNSFGFGGHNASIVLVPQV
ncbi:MAG: beta-ketoacyl-ACP synthase II [Acidimicrobiia bacterium]